jgi:hypothetical protein
MDNNGGFEMSMQEREPFSGAGLLALVILVATIAGGSIGYAVGSLLNWALRGF